VVFPITVATSSTDAREAGRGGGKKGEGGGTFTNTSLAERGVLREKKEKGREGVRLFPSMFEGKERRKKRKGKGKNDDRI